LSALKKSRPFQRGAVASVEFAAFDQKGDQTMNADLRFFRGAAIGILASLPLWAVIVYGVWRLFR
jgi:hypothetical protein